MEILSVTLNDSARWDDVLDHSLPDGGDLEIVTKDGATVTGRGGLMITFTVEMLNGSIQRVQTVTTIRLFRAYAQAIITSYDDEGFRVNMTDPLNDGVITEETKCQ